MSLFAHVLPGQGHGQGASAISQLGPESLARKGGLGQTHTHAALSKDASIRMLRDGFGIRNPSNVDLISHRKPHPAPGATSSHAGSLPSSRVGRNTPDVIRETSIEHTVQRRHLSPSDTPRQAPGCMVMGLASCARDAASVGRKVGPRRSLSPQLTPQTSPRQTCMQYNRRPRSHSPLPSAKASPRTSLQRSMSAMAMQLANELGGPCTWGEVHAFTAPGASSEKPIESESELSPIEVSFGPSLSDCYLKKVASSSGMSDDDVSTQQPHSPSCRSMGFTSSSASFRSFSSFLDVARTEPSTMNFGKSRAADDILFARLYERRLQAMVKAAHKKALKSVA